MNYAVDMKKTGAHIKKLLAEKNITVAEIQKKLKLKSPQTIYRWFYGAALPTVDHLYMLACMLQVPVDELLVLTTETLSDERVMEIIGWCNGKMKESDKLRLAYWEKLGFVILPPKL